ncbi:hypothetical protein BAX94_04140 [Elizabethkingia meningoseptica]|uniref:DUF2326 domain-containing protein n=1 Tax=Elizabethkingia meningoseptica TaxID=238 RepID=UPI00084196CE|nr:DUF2326 domain-containing protein [Elizabethkingia meningoseptica]MDE5448340.1 DUF2326 domain-containing protein [Elizabethkingia meningoseptica]MDE5466681.1 DUF2326 domain-containing protein [Elizabethkingia meningoseptica]MDE5470048.1 DUF2326 domain-containing protein [Elizabethkingia meningoseptica]MDE5474089.1 DUF2326 domain-containing protein [Elizabethkingia meningoseptica]MDE5477522.1 DUF2326 domain-containing protein [Elizabethkingia meningoseptica]
MFIKLLTISTEKEIIRTIPFHKGLNLIVDESDNQITGNSVGKTTTLKLIDFCLGGSPKNIYIDPESKRQEYKLIKDFLVEHKVIITLVLTRDLDDENAEEIEIERNFLSRKNIIRRINGEQYTEDEFEIKLSKLLFPDHNSDKPTFRQIISHNVRYKDQSINNTLKTLDGYTTDAEYETLYLFLFGCDFTKGNNKQAILTKLNQEYTYKERLEKTQTKTAYETTLALINNDIEKLKEKKSSFNLNENFEADLEKLNYLKYKINKVSSEIGRLNIRKNLIKETEEELNNNISSIDVKQLEIIYSQATSLITNIQRTFHELVSYHNQMLVEKAKFITKELPLIESGITENEQALRQLLTQEKELIEIIAKSDSFEELEALVIELNEKHQKKGEYENIIKQLEEVEGNIKGYNEELNKIDDELFSDEFEQIVKTQLNKFNKHFANISNKLYGEQYALKYDIVTNKKGQRLYKFNAFNTNLSSGKKQGEISCFDIAYTLFADEEGIPCLHFLLNDKKELMDDKQLVKIAEFVNEHNIQFVASILKDKLPEELNDEKYFIVKLSQSSKLFKIRDN